MHPLPVKLIVILKVCLYLSESILMLSLLSEFTKPHIEFKYSVQFSNSNHKLIVIDYY